MKTADMIGKKFGKLTVLLDLGGTPRKVRTHCECGAVKDQHAQGIREGRVFSCGCARAANIGKALTVHGKSRTKVHNIWSGMRQRCEDHRSKYYADYGGRGISVCDRWKSFDNFYLDMGEPPDGMTIERRNNDGWYSPDNCYWATKKEQANNRRSNKLITLGGVTLSQRQWEEKLGLGKGRIWDRLNSGWTIEEALTGKRA